jgi:hypothetical protein
MSAWNQNTPTHACALAHRTFLRAAKAKLLELHGSSYRWSPRSLHHNSRATSTTLLLSQFLTAFKRKFSIPQFFGVGVFVFLGNRLGGGFLGPFLLWWIDRSGL